MYNRPSLPPRTARRPSFRSHWSLSIAWSPDPTVVETTGTYTKKNELTMSPQKPGALTSVSTFRFHTSNLPSPSTLAHDSDATWHHKHNPSRWFSQSLCSPQFDCPVHRTNLKNPQAPLTDASQVPLRDLHGLYRRRTGWDQLLPQHGRIIHCLPQYLPRRLWFRCPGNRVLWLQFVVSRMNKLERFLKRNCEIMPRKDRGESITCGCASMSTNQPHTVPSVLLVIRSCA